MNLKKLFEQAKAERAATKQAKLVEAQITNMTQVSKTTVAKILKPWLKPDGYTLMVDDKYVPLLNEPRKSFNVIFHAPKDKGILKNILPKAKEKEMLALLRDAAPNFDVSLTVDNSNIEEFGQKHVIVKFQKRGAPIPDHAKKRDF